ncbi:MAG: PD40 domain-containing protein, partial [Cytophagaceae bacterium]|nr:PD40 domain-containing protein [Gemmatimonadaceae bacterium]
MTRMSIGALLLVVGMASAPGAQGVGADRSPVPAAREPAGALAYDLAFDLHEFPWSSTIAISRDGARAAYAIRRSPGNVNLSNRYMPNGTPSSVVGSQVYLKNQRGAPAVVVCPGGNCWAPSLSPDGATLVFFSDRDGPPQLWAYDLAAQRSRRLSPARVKAKLWTGDEAQWSPDSRTVFVPMAPDSGPGAWLPTPESAGPASRPEGPTVSVLRGGSEEKKATQAAAQTPRQEFYHRENNAAIGAVDVRSGTVRIVAPATAAPRPSVMRLSASGRWISYLSVFKDHGITNQVSTVDLAVVPVGGGAPKVVASDLPLLSDYHGRNYTWHPTEDALVYLKDGQLWHVAMSASGPGTPRRLGESLGTLAPSLHWFTRDGKGVVV